MRNVNQFKLQISHKHYSIRTSCLSLLKLHHFQSLSTVLVVIQALSWICLIQLSITKQGDNDEIFQGLPDYHCLTLFWKFLKFPSL